METEGTSGIQTLRSRGMRLTTAVVGGTLAGTLARIMRTVIPDPREDPESRSPNLGP